MDTHARIIPNHLGQPYKVSFGIEALRLLGLDVGAPVTLSLVGDVLSITPDPNGAKVIRKYTKGAAPYVSASEWLAPINAKQPLTRHPLHAEIRDGILYVNLRRVLTQEEYRWRRWKKYQRHDPTMHDTGATDLEAKKGQNITTPVPLPKELRAALEHEAETLKLTVPTYIVQILNNRPAVTDLKAKDWRGGGWMVRNARSSDTPLTAEEMIQRGIPPASDREWLLARIAEGMTYSAMAQKWGGSSSVYAAWGKRFGVIRKPRKSRG